MYIFGVNICVARSVQILYTRTQSIKSLELG